MTQEVLNLARPARRRALDIPAGYTLARNMQEMYGVSGAAMPGVARMSSAAPDENPRRAFVSDRTASTPGVVAANAPKKEGAVRICQVS